MSRSAAMSADRGGSVPREVPATDAFVRSRGRSPRVLFVNYTSGWTGPTNSLLHMVRRLKDRWDVHVLFPGEGPLGEELAREGVSAVSMSRITKAEVLRIRRVIRELEVDVVYGNNTWSTSRVALVAARLAGVPFVSHVRGIGWDGSWRRLGYLRFCQAVIAVSQACADSVRRFAGSRRLHVVHNGIDTDRIPEPRPPEEVRSELGVPKGATVYLNVSHVNARKGQLQLLRAFHEVLGSVDDPHLLILGALDRDPEYVAQVRDEIGRLGLADRVQILGFRTDVADVLGAVDVVVHTALADPHPRSVLEAMAARRAVAAYGVDGVAETVVHEETGLLVEAGSIEALAEAMARLGGDPGLRREMGEAGRERVTHVFSDRATAAGVERILLSILADRPR